MSRFLPLCLLGSKLASKVTPYKSRNRLLNCFFGGRKQQKELDILLLTICMTETWQLANIQAFKMSKWQTFQKQDRALQI